MKKKLISAMAISLCLCMGAMVGCGDNLSSSSSSSSSSSLSPSDPAESGRQDEILAKIGEAYEATKAYTGAYTVKRTGSFEDKDYEDEKSTTGTDSLYLTVNPAQKAVYYKSVEDSFVEEEKLLKNGEDYIRYYKNTWGEDEPIESYSKYSEAYANYYLNEHYGIASVIDRYVDAEEIFKIESIDAYNAAYAKVFADSVAEIEEGKEDEESYFYGCTASGSSTVSAVETEDGAYVLTSKMNIQVSSSVEKSTYAATYETTLTAKGGKLVACTEKYEEVETQEGSDTETQTSIDKSDSAYMFSYAFDQTVYDSLTLSVPSDVTALSGYWKNFDLVYNGIGGTMTDVTGNRLSTVQEAVEIALELAQRRGITTVWYTDEACTKEVNAATMTEAEFYALDTLYAKATPKAGYAIVVETKETVFAADVPAEYKLVFGMMLGKPFKQLIVVDIDDPVDIQGDDGERVYLDGVEQTVPTFTAESGKTYEVKYVEEVSKAYLNIFMMMDF